MLSSGEIEECTQLYNNMDTMNVTLKRDDINKSKEQNFNTIDKLIFLIVGNENVLRVEVGKVV